MSYRYGAAILSIHREGEHIRSKIGAVKFKVTHFIMVFLVIVQSHSTNSLVIISDVNL